MKVNELNIADFNTAHCSVGIDPTLLARKFKRAFGPLKLYNITTHEEAQQAIDDCYITSDFYISKLVLIEGTEYDIADAIDYTESTTHGKQTQETRNLKDRTDLHSGTNTTYNSTDTRTDNLTEQTTNPTQTHTEKKNTFDNQTLNTTGQTEDSWNGNTQRTNSGTQDTAHTGTDGVANTGYDEVSRTGTDTYINSGTDIRRIKGYNTPLEDLLLKEAELAKKEDPYDVLCGLLVKEICCPYFD